MELELSAAVLVVAWEGEERSGDGGDSAVITSEGGESLRCEVAARLESRPRCLDGSRRERKQRKRKRMRSPFPT